MSNALQPLSGLDALFLHLETPQMPMHVGSLSLLKLPPGFDGDFAAEVRTLIGRRLHLAAPFTRKLAPVPLGFANPVWTQVRPADVDLHRHIRRVSLPAPGTLGQLQARVAELHERPLDRTRPLWELTVIDGLGGRLKGHVGYYAKLHHSAIDGQAGVALARAMLDATPQPRAVPPAAAGAANVEPTTADVLGATARNTWAQLRQLPRLLPAVARSGARAIAQALQPPERTAPAPVQRPMGPSGAAALPARAAQAARSALADLRSLLGPRTALNGAIGAQRAYATLSLPLPKLRAMAAALGVTLNDLLLAVCSGALRRWLAAHGGVPAEPLFAGVPFTLRAQGDTAHTNQVSMMRAALATHLADPAARLAAIHASMDRGKRLSGSVREIVPTDYPTLGSPWLLAGLAQLLSRTPLAAHVPTVINVAISNVAGPPEPLYVAGAKVVHYWPISIVVHGVALNITVQSYAGALEFGLTACRCTVPDLARIVRHLKDAFDEYAALAHSSMPAARPRRARPARVAPPQGPAGPAAVPAQGRANKRPNQPAARSIKAAPAAPESATQAARTATRPMTSKSRAVATPGARARTTRAVRTSG